MKVYLPELSNSAPPKQFGSVRITLPPLGGSAIPVPETEGDLDINTWEGKLAVAAVRAGPFAVNLFARAEAVANIMPLLWMGIPSQRADIKESGVTKRLLWDSLWFLPYGKILTGVGAISKNAQFSLSKLTKYVSPPASKLSFRSLSAVEKEMPERIKWLQEEGWKKAAKKLGITEREGFALWTGEHAGANSIWWARNPQSGAWYGTESSKKFKSLFGLNARLSKGAKKTVDYFKKTPLDIQKARHYREAWKKNIIDILGGKKLNMSFEGMFSHQMELIMGSTRAKGLKLADADARTMAGLWENSLNMQRHILKTSDPGFGSKLPTIILPVRKVMGYGERIFGTHSMFERLKLLYETSNKWNVAQLHNLFFRLEAGGFGKVIKKQMKVGIDKADKPIYEENIVRFKNADWFDKDFEKGVGTITSKMDEMSMLGKTSEEKWAYLTSVTKEGSKLREYVTDIHKPYTDDLYKSYMMGRITQLFEMESNLLTPNGKAMLEDFLVGIESKANALFPKIETLLNPKINPSSWTKGEGVKQLVEEVRNIVNPEIFRTKMPDGKAVSLVTRQQSAQRIIKGLTFSEKGRPGFANYLDNYTMRVFQDRVRQANARTVTLTGKKHAGFIKARTKDLMEEETLTYFRGLQARVAGQARELYVYPHLERAVQEIKQMPQGYRDAFEHWIGRMHGEPTATDVATAKWFTANLGGLSKLFGREEIWSARRVMDLGHTVTDLVFLGGLGFKPHSAVRNLFQTLLNVPTDMGGIKDFGWLLQGYKRAMRDPAVRQYIRDIGAIGEFAEELYLHAPRIKFNPKVKGRELDWQRFRDAGMWMFKRSDQFNRYVTGAAAVTKWDSKAAKHFGSGKWFPERMSKDLKFGGRESWVTSKLEATLDRAVRLKESNPQIALRTLEEAKQLYVKDIIADTQWLYGKAEAPLINSRWGVVSKTGVIFQSWWMNYLASLEKWTRTPGTVAKLDRFGTWLISAAIAGELMEYGAGFKESKVERTRWLGPIPRKLNEFMIPSPWRPVYEAMNGLADVATGDFDQAKRRGVQFLRSGMMYIPGGLQISSTFRDVKKFGAGEGLARSITGYYSDLER